MAAKKRVTLSKHTAKAAKKIKKYVEFKKKHIHVNKTIVGSLAVVAMLFVSFWGYEFFPEAALIIRNKQPEDTCAMIKNETGAVILKNEDVVLPVNCFISLDDEEDPAVLYISKLGDLSIRRGYVSLIYLKDSSRAKDYSHAVDAKEVGATYLKPGAFAFEDINFDGYLDLAVRSSSGAYNEAYDYYLYNPKTKRFALRPLFKDMVNASFDSNGKTISTFNKGRGAGDVFASRVYEFRDGRYLLTKETAQDFVDPSDETKGYIYIEKELKNGAMVMITQKKLSRESVLGR